jgi:hypothetical protein
VVEVERVNVNVEVVEREEVRHEVEGKGEYNV